MVSNDHTKATQFGIYNSIGSFFGNSLSNCQAGSGIYTKYGGAYTNALYVLGPVPLNSPTISSQGYNHYSSLFSLN